MAPEEAVVDVHVCVAGGLEPVRRHRARRVEYDVLRNVDAERVPAGPAHERTYLRIIRGRNLGRVEKARRACRHRLAAGSLKPRQIHIRLTGVKVDADALVALRALAEFHAPVLLPRSAGRLGTPQPRRKHTSRRGNHQLLHHHFLLLLALLQTMPSANACGYLTQTLSRLACHSPPLRAKVQSGCSFPLLPMPTSHGADAELKWLNAKTVFLDLRSCTWRHP